MLKEVYILLELSKKQLSAFQAKTYRILNNHNINNNYYYYNNYITN